MVPLGKDRLYCVYRTSRGYPCHCYSEDGGRTWTEPEPMSYSPGGRIVRTPRACPKLWKCSNGKFLFWFHMNGGPNFAGQYSQPGGLNFRGRNPAWVLGGELKDGRMVWSQPEILLYSKDPEVRMSYPDLIEQNGRFWVTETQKTVARIHPVDGSLLEGMWAQLDDELPTDPVAAGCILDLGAGDLKLSDVEPGKPISVEDDKGFTVDFWLTVDQFTSGQILLDSRDDSGAGWAISVSENRTLTLTLGDGARQSSWSCDEAMLSEGRKHHVVFVADGGPGIISVVVDGVLCNGGNVRKYGWGRFDLEIGDVSGTGRIVTDSEGVSLHQLRLYNRYLRTGEVIQNYRADARMGVSSLPVRPATRS